VHDEKGDKVKVKFDGDIESDNGELIDMNATIRTERGGFMNGMVGTIEELQHYVRSKEKAEMPSER